MPTGAAALPAVLVPAGASGSAGGAATAAAVPEADTPSSLADQPAHGSMHLGLRPASREGSGRHAITLTADGSGRGGRAFFDTPSSSRPGSRADTRDARWHQAVAEESALEAHSLQHGPHPAATAGRGVTAGQAALQESRAAAAVGAQQNGQLREYTAVWLVEDGSPRAQPTEGPHTGTANGAPPPAGPGKQPGGGDDGSGKGGDSGGGGGTFGRKDAFEGATVLIEEAEERKYFSWAAYWGSLPKKLKGGWGGFGWGGRRWMVLGGSKPRPLGHAATVWPAQLLVVAQTIAVQALQHVLLPLVRQLAPHCRCRRPVCRRPGHAAADSLVPRDLLGLAGRFPG